MVMTSFNWARREPNDIESREECLEVRRYGSAAADWNDEFCTTELPYTCEVETSSTS